MYGTTGVTWDPLTLALLGQTKDDKPLIDEVNDRITKAARDLNNEKAAGKATITVTVTLEKSGDNAVLISHDVKYREPKVKRHATMAIRNDEGQLVVQEHRQTSLDFNKVTSINNARKD